MKIAAWMLAVVAASVGAGFALGAFIQWLATN